MMFSNYFERFFDGFNLVIYEIILVRMSMGSVLLYIIMVSVMRRLIIV